MFGIFEELMKQKGLTIYRIAKGTGLTTTFFYKWREKDYIPKYETLKVIADYLGVTPEYLRGEQEDVKVVSTIPILGYVPCGEPIEAVEDIVGYANVSPVIAKDYFGLYAKGNSMYPRIEEGDLLIVKLTPKVDSGRIAIVKVNGDEATCKKVVYNEAGITLVPLNGMYDPITFTAEEAKEKPVQIIGEVKEIRRAL